MILVVGCALMFSAADLLRKVLSAWIRPFPLLLALTAGLAPLFIAWWARDGFPTPQASYWPPGLTSTVLNVAANLAFLEAIRRSPLSITIPLLSLTPVFTTVLAIPMLGELPSPLQALGVTIVVAGALWLHLEDGELSMSSAWAAFRREPGSRLMALTALLWSCAVPLDKLALTASGVPFHGTVLCVGITLVLLILLTLRGRLSELEDLRYRPALALGTIVLGAAALVLQLLALGVVWVGFVETMKRGLGSVLALVWGRLIFDEALTRHRLTAVLAMAAGVSLILL